MRTILLILTLFCLGPAFGQEHPNNYLIARAYMLNHAYDSAVIYLDEVINESPRDLTARMNLGKCYFELARYDNALAEFLIVNRQRSSMASLMLAKTEAKLKHNELAVKYLRDHLSSSYKLPEKNILLDEDFFSLQNSSAWKGLWKEKEWYNQYDQELQESVYLKSIGENLESINLLNDLDKKGFKRSLINQNLAEIYLVSGNEKAAMDALEKSIHTDSRNLEALKMRIQLLYSQGEYEKAKNDCDRLLRVAPDEFEHYLISGRIESHLGAYKSALDKVNFYLELFPHSAKALNELGEIHFENGKYLNAITAFNKTLEQDKSNPLFYFNRGLTYAATKTFKYAERDFSMALDLDPLNPEIWYQKGFTDLALGKGDTACYDFKKALQYGKYEAREFLEKNCN